MNEVPQGLDSNDFEDWLWRREKPRRLEQIRQLTNLRDREVFPSFDALPNKNSVSPDFNEEHDGTHRPVRHWCFLGEIVDFTILHHLELKLADIDNKEVPLHFYTHGRGSEMVPEQIHKGHTIAVLYAEGHVFAYGDPGIRHEDSSNMKVRDWNPRHQTSLSLTDTGDIPKVFPVPLEDC